MRDEFGWGGGLLKADRPLSKTQKLKTVVHEKDKKAHILLPAS